MNRFNACGMLISAARVLGSMFSPLEDRIRELCALVTACRSDEEIVAVMGELRTLLHEHVELARSHAKILPSLDHPYDVHHK